MIEGKYMHKVEGSDYRDIVMKVINKMLIRLQRQPLINDATYKIINMEILQIREEMLHGQCNNIK